MISSLTCIQVSTVLESLECTCTLLEAIVLLSQQTSFHEKQKQKSITVILLFAEQNLLIDKDTANRNNPRVHTAMTNRSAHVWFCLTCFGFHSLGSRNGTSQTLSGVMGFPGSWKFISTGKQNEL